MDAVSDNPLDMNLVPSMKRKKGKKKDAAAGEPRVHRNSLAVAATHTACMLPVNPVEAATQLQEGRHWWCVLRSLCEPHSSLPHAVSRMLL